jgi:hypothetical protein
MSEERFTLYVVETSFDGEDWFNTPTNPRGPLADAHLDAHEITGMFGFLNLKDAQALVKMEKDSRLGIPIHYRILKLKVLVKRSVVEEF